MLSERHGPVPIEAEPVELVTKAEALAASPIDSLDLAFRPD